MKKLLLVCVMLTACGVDNVSDATQMSIDPQACPVDSECEQNRIDRAERSAEARATREATAIEPGHTVSRVHAECRVDPRNSNVTVCWATVDFQLVAVTVYCDIETNPLGDVTSVECHII